MKRKFILDLASAALAGAVIFGSKAGVAQEGAAAPASTPAFVRGRRNVAPLIDENAKLVNLALVATPSTSFVSGDQTIFAINDGANPRRTVEHYGNWPRGGTQWVEYIWPKSISTNKVDVYWYTDGAGLRLPKASRLKYFDGADYVEVPNAKGLGAAGDVWNVHSKLRPQQPHRSLRRVDPRRRIGERCR